MEYKLECPGFFLRTETCTGPVNRFDAAALAPERQTLALEGLPMAASVQLLGLLAEELTRMEVRFQPVFSPDFPGEPEALLIGPLLILPGTLLTDPDARLAACHLSLAHPCPSREALEQTALLRTHRERLLRQGRLYLLTGAAAREECRQAVCPDADPRKIRRLGERLISQEFARGESGTVREGWLTAVGAAGQQIAAAFPSDWRILRLEDPYGTFAPELLSQLSSAAREYRQEQLVCRCPLASDVTIEHLFLPALRLGFVTSNHFHTFPDDPQRVINARRFVSAGTLRREKALLLDRKRLQRQSLTGAARSLAEAGSLSREMDTLLLGAPGDLSGALARVLAELEQSGVL